MRARMAWLCIARLLLACGLWSQTFEVQETDGMQWFKGNTHAHTNVSDGDSSPEAVASWYMDHGYRFIVFTDHNERVEAERRRLPDGSDFIPIAGEELSGSYRGLMAHVNGLDIPRSLNLGFFPTMLETLQFEIDSIRGVGGVPIVNHPSAGWAIDQETLALLRDVHLFELYNGSPSVKDFQRGDAIHPSLEEEWDFILGSGKRMFGVAADDMSYLKRFAPNYNNPGRGWVVVRSRTSDPKEIVRNLDAGLFYASTGIELVDVLVEPTRMTVAIAATRTGLFKTDFIGDRGKVLLCTAANPAIYELSGGESYVRARVTDEAGHTAWVQPVFVRK